MVLLPKMTLSTDVQVIQILVESHDSHIHDKLVYSLSWMFFMDKETILKIETIYDSDQRAIKKFKRKEISLNKLNEINSKNTDFIIGIIEKFGFPFKNKTSEKAYTASFLTVQHSGNVELMEKVIDTLSKADNGGADKKDIAYLIDRVRVLKNMPQIYGTQYKIFPRGKIEFFPIENPESVNKKREEYDLESIDEYLQKIKSNL